MGGRPHIGDLADKAFLKIGGKIILQKGQNKDPSLKEKKIPFLNFEGEVK